MFKCLYNTIFSQGYLLFVPSYLLSQPFLSNKLDSKKQENSGVHQHPQMSRSSNLPHDTQHNNLGGMTIEGLNWRRCQDNHLQISIISLSYWWLAWRLRLFILSQHSGGLKPVINPACAKQASRAGHSRLLTPLQQMSTRPGVFQTEPFNSGSSISTYRLQQFQPSYSATYEISNFPYHQSPAYPVARKTLLNRKAIHPSPYPPNASTTSAAMNWRGLLAPPTQWDSVQYDKTSTFRLGIFA